MKNLMQEVAQQYAKDKAMLESMALSLRDGSPFSYTHNDMADLLDRIREDHIDHMVPA